MLVGMIMAARAFLNENPCPSEMEIRNARAGNLCRCTGYPKIVKAITMVKAAGESGNGR
jgi:aerobic-type carbon monoxide dehydrogenase small subunit (CoxS/CutS family)